MLNARQQIIARDDVIINSILTGFRKGKKPFLTSNVCFIVFMEASFTFSKRLPSTFFFLTARVLQIVICCNILTPQLSL